MFGSLGGPELVLILVIALIVFGPRKLPEMGKSLGKMLVEFRRASNEFKRTIEDEVEAEKAKPVVAAAPVGSPPLLAGEGTPGVPPAESEGAAPPGTVAVGTAPADEPRSFDP